MKKKILILSLGRTGSLPIYAENIVTNFRNNDFDILISKNRLVKNNLRNATEIKTYSDKLSFVFNTLFYLPIKFICLIPKIYEQYSTLYLPYQHFWDFPFIFFFKLLNRRIVFTVHDGILHKGEKNVVSQFLSNFRLQLATEIIYLTDYVKNNVGKEYNIFKEANIVPHPVIENKYVNLDVKKENTKNLLFFGRIDQYKGVELLMQSVLNASNDIDKLIIAGKSQYGIEYLNHPRIEIRDYYLSEEEIGDLFTWADVLVLPYTEASQSGVIALGIFAELPMICTNVGGFSEQLNADESFWCDPNINDLSNAIVEAFSNKKKYNEIKEKLKIKKTRLSIKTISQEIENILFKKY